MTGTVTPGKWLRAERPLLDRDAERAAIDDLLNVVRRGFGGMLVLRGGHGVGKTSLAGYAVGAASGFQVSVIAGVESEIQLEYGAVHQLLLPFLPLVDDLPVPQREAIRVAFGLEAGPVTGGFLVGLACLTLLSRAAADRPVLCVVDDANWIDAESALVLGFVARRLHADRVGVILTVGEGGGPSAFGQFPGIEVGGLTDDAAAELLRSVAGAPLDSQTMDRVLAGTERNPLALVETGSQFSAGELAERAYRPEPIPVGQQLQERYQRRVLSLPADAREFLLLAAADVSGDRGLVRHAAATAGIDADAAETAAEQAGLIEVSGGSVRFRKPLVRAAVYHGAADAGRRRAHHRLGQAADSEAAGGVWHRAAAAAGPDESLAADVQIAAERARDRGAWATAAALLRRAVALTPGDGARARREVALAEAQLVTGHPDTAQDVLGDALRRLPSGGMRGLAQGISGAALFAQGRDAEAAEVLAGSAAALADDPVAAANAQLAALRAAMWAGPGETRKIASMAVPPPRPTESAPSVADLLLAGYWARLTEDYAAAAAPFRAAMRALRADDLDPITGLGSFGPGAAAAGSLWDDEAMLDIAGRWLRLARRLGALSQLPFALGLRAIADVLTGRLDQAADRWAEIRELMAAGQISGMLGIGSYVEGMLLAYRGDSARARAAGLAHIRRATAHDQGGPPGIGEYIVAIADLRAGNFGAAYATASKMVKDDMVLMAEWALPELIEAAVRSGHQDAAASAFATLASRASTAGTPWALGVRARCQALLADGAEPEGAYTEAISQLERCHAAVDLARAHLQYGQWLRRANRRRDARRQLHTAHAMFQAMGADGFAGQAATELRATGERGQPPTAGTALDLTAQEAKVANLAADGATNNEIAARLFISASTVHYHLSKVFRKLGITGRAQLAHRLPGR
ncbi:MAG TPA: LuxR C-terminal-related transcriptional regulator [Streptosporangiaceae bacterium]|nr:LuxR C-terminal-related transcriptional regulator [Streptosporangiaceae bacterium]